MNLCLGILQNGQFLVSPPAVCYCWLFTAARFFQKLRVRVFLLCWDALGFIGNDWHWTITHGFRFAGQKGGEDLLQNFVIHSCARCYNWTEHSLSKPYDFSLFDVGAAVIYQGVSMNRQTQWWLDEPTSGTLFNLRRTIQVQRIHTRYPMARRMTRRTEVLPPPAPLSYRSPSCWMSIEPLTQSPNREVGRKLASFSARVLQALLRDIPQRS